jgi:hypothetical protein
VFVLERAAQEAAAEAEEVAEAAAAAAEAAVAVVEAAAAEEADAEDADAEEAAAALIPMARPPLTIAVSKASAVHVVRGGQPGTARLCARRREPA